jgi:hypothetical protein
MKSGFLEDRFKKAVRKAGEQVTEVAVRTVEVAQDEPKGSTRRVVLVRALQAVLDSLERIDDFDKVASASSNLEVVLALLEEPDVISQLAQSDPLANAKLRGIRAQAKLTQAEGGCISAEEAGQLIGISKAAIHKARIEGRLLGLPRGQSQFVFPIWQFDSGQILAGLKDVYASLDCDPWMKASFMLSPNTRLSKETPLALMRRGEIEKVVTAAKSFGEHGAV